MAFFKFRKSNDETAAAPLLPDSLEEMRRRAKYRLIGSAVLVLIGVVGFPLLFDNQPRPISVDMPIDIPERNKAKPLALPATAVAVVPAAPASAPEIIEEKSTPELASVAQAAPKVIAKPEPVLAAKPPEKVPEKAADKHAAAPTAVPVPKPVAKVDESEKVKALLNGQGIDKASEAVVGRYVVQVGAFADPAKAREARLKLEHAGLKTYTHVAETKDGSRIRVRVGPFSTKAEADKAAQKVKTLKLAASVLTL
jgi:DedD protein